MGEVLKLVLKGCWYDMIESGEKTEEYRVIKPYWVKRLFCDLGNFVAGQPVRYKAVTFYHGYAKDRRQMTFEIQGITFGFGKQKWGAPKEQVFIIKLGSRIS